MRKTFDTQVESSLLGTKGFFITVMMLPLFIQLS